MVKIELDVDLNELTDEELEAYLKLKKKGKAKKLKKETPKLPVPEEKNEIAIDELEEIEPEPQIVDESIEPEVKYRTVVKEKEVRIKRKNRTEKEWGDLFLDIRAHMKKKDCSFAEASRKIAQSEPNYDRYKKWCKEKNIDPRIRGKDFSPDKRRIPGYLEQRNEFLKWKNEQVAFIMKYHNMNMIEANRYLAGVWHKSRKNPFIATEFIKREKDRIKVKPGKCLPQLIHLNSSQLTILQGMISNIISRPELTISFQMEGAMLGFEDYQNWVDFCKDFIDKKDKIAECFGIEPSFSLVGTGRMGLAIKYKG